MTFGEPRFFYERVSSTQDVAREMARAGAIPGTVIAAATMKAGRGRRGRTWHAPPNGNVTLTAIGASVPPETLWQLTFVSGVAAVEALAEIAPATPARLRFPNDVQIDGRKLGGILVEAMLQGGSAIPLIGIGLNVAPREWPEDLANRAIALSETDNTASVEEVEKALLSALTRIWHQWQMDGFEAILPLYNAYRDLEARREFVRDGKTLRCKVLHMAVDGTVTLEAEDGIRWSACAPEVVLGND
ncbi:MAG: biotin--[acetyl-CoA-carboxylase] ligase [Armatimonas sp.]